MEISQKAFQAERQKKFLEKLDELELKIERQEEIINSLLKDIAGLKSKKTKKRGATNG